MFVECPACKSSKLKITFNKHHIPYFGEAMESVVRCSACGYHNVDVMLLEEKEPSRYILEVKNEKDLNIRVVRSSYSTVKVPELGVKITPGPEAEGYISNVEGVLERIENIVKATKLWNKDKKIKKADRLLKKIENIKNGKEKMTLIIEDPSGNSVIISKKASKEPLA